MIRRIRLLSIPQWRLDGDRPAVSHLGDAIHDAPDPHIRLYHPVADTRRAHQPKAQPANSTRLQHDRRNTRTAVNRPSDAELARDVQKVLVTFGGAIK